MRKIASLKNLEGDTVYPVTVVQAIKGLSRATESNHIYIDDTNATPSTDPSDFENCETGDIYIYQEDETNQSVYMLTYITYSQSDPTVKELLWWKPIDGGSADPIAIAKDPVFAGTLISSNSVFLSGLVAHSSFRSYVLDNTSLMTGLASNTTFTTSLASNGGFTTLLLSNGSLMSGIAENTYFNNAFLVNSSLLSSIATNSMFYESLASTTNFIDKLGTNLPSNSYFVANAPTYLGSRIAANAEFGATAPSYLGSRIASDSQFLTAAPSYLGSKIAYDSMFILGFPNAIASYESAKSTLGGQLYPYVYGVGSNTSFLNMFSTATNGKTSFNNAMDRNILAARQSDISVNSTSWGAITLGACPSPVSKAKRIKLAFTSFLPTDTVTSINIPWYAGAFGLSYQSTASIVATDYYAILDLLNGKFINMLYNNDTLLSQNEYTFNTEYFIRANKNYNSVFSAGYTAGFKPSTAKIYWE